MKNRVFFVTSLSIMTVFLSFFLVNSGAKAQEVKFFFPDKSRPKPMMGVSIINVTTTDNLKLQAWYFPSVENKKPTILLFHGNGGNIAHRYPKMKEYIDLGYGVLLAEYRGYGGNAGTPGEQGFYEDGRAYMNWLIKENRPSGIILYGESIGSGTATQMAIEYPVVKGLILETPMASLLSIGGLKNSKNPLYASLEDGFMNIEKISKINMPLLILHGRKDQVIPFPYAQELFDAAVEPKKFIIFPKAGHNNLYDFGAGDNVVEFLKETDSGNVESVSVEHP